MRDECVAVIENREEVHENFFKHIVNSIHPICTCSINANEAQGWVLEGADKITHIPFVYVFVYSHQRLSGLLRIGWCMHHAEKKRA